MIGPRWACDISRPGHRPGPARKPAGHWLGINTAWSACRRAGVRACESTPGRRRIRPVLNIKLLLLSIINLMKWRCGNQLGLFRSSASGLADVRPLAAARRASRGPCRHSGGSKYRTGWSLCFWPRKDTIGHYQSLVSELTVQTRYESSSAGTRLGSKQEMGKRNFKPGRHLSVS